MRISRKKRPDKLLIPKYNKNHQIKAEEVRLLGATKENLGVMSIEAARTMADEQEMDLVEINPKSVPPICMIVDFANFKYQKEKEAKKLKANTHVVEIKGIRLTVRMSDHDMGVRCKQASKFLDRGDKVKVEIILRGRENSKPQLAFDAIDKFYTTLSKSFSLKYEQEPAKQTNKITATIVKK
jgi:translation initiation factor IF-3